MSSTMRAAVVTDFGQPLAIEDRPLPVPGPGQVLVHIEASGVCHTDLHARDGDWPVRPTLPFVPGHEGVGRVVELGPGAEGVAVGDLVGVPWLHTACGRCTHCASGWETLCESQQNTGYSVDGGFAEYVLADPQYVGRIPEGLDPVLAAPVLCAGVTVYKGLKETEVRPGQWVAVSGIGGLGHMAVQYAVAMGMRVVAVDIAADKLELARKLGAEVTVDARDGDAVAVVQDRVGGVHGVLVTAVGTEAFAQGVGMLRRGGTMALVGLPPGSFDLPIFDVVLTRKTIRGSIVGTRVDLEEALDFAAQGKVVPHVSTEPLEAVNAVFARMQRGEIDGRVVLTR